MRSCRIIFALLLFFVVTLPLTADAARGNAARTGERDPRYAALIMNPQTGEIYHSRSADTRRYPASLTKMMTLYLLFEDLAARKVTLNSKLNVSSYAATMPQTNISLTPKDRIPVETAIKALVVRSANDVAVVVAENLNGSVDAFAKRSTDKARALGMNGTVFKNPHGLPNSGQYTTARDMAKLGIALKRDFPQYWDYFTTRQFSWKGKTYYTHNRVMLRYSGTEGIKTGYINASGFNLVSYTNRGGRPLVGVVLGGTSSSWRDNQMIALLDKGYKVIASRGQKTGRIYAANLPTPRAGGASAPKASSPAPEVTMARVAADRGVAKAATTSTLDAQMVGRAQGGLSSEAASDAVWGIQVGAFSSQALAERAVRQAYSQAAGTLQGSRMTVIGAGGPGTTIHRARLENLSEHQAKKACEMLIAQNSPCFIFKTDAQNL